LAEQDYDKSKAEEFASTIFQLLNGGMLSLMISIGYKTNLFDTISQLEPSTSQEIAQAAKLDERYVREWLGAMVTGNIIKYDTSTEKYYLPKEHSAFLTRKSGIDNLAVFTQYVSLMGNVEDKNMGLTNVRFEIKDALLVEELGKYDLITAFDTIHDQAQPTRVLKAINASLKSDGFFLMQDIAASSMVDKNIDSPLAPALYTISTMHCMSVSLAYNGEGLGTMWGKELAVKKLTEAGFKDIKVKNVEGDIINYYYLSRKS
jgi:hypothetical protein